MNRKTVAVIGASGDRGKFGNKAIRAYLAQGWDVYPVNPKGGEIEGVKVYPSIEDVPVPIDRVTLYLPPAVGIKVLPAIAAAGQRGRSGRSCDRADNPRRVGCSDSAGRVTLAVL